MPATQTSLEIHVISGFWFLEPPLANSRAITSLTIHQSWPHAPTCLILQLSVACAQSRYVVFDGSPLTVLIFPNTKTSNAMHVCFLRLLRPFFLSLYSFSRAFFNFYPKHLPQTCKTPWEQKTERNCICVPRTHFSYFKFDFLRMRKSIL